MSLQKFVEIFMEQYNMCKHMGYKFGNVPVEQRLLKRSEEYHSAFSAAHGKLYRNLIARTEEMVVTQIFFR